MEKMHRPDYFLLANEYNWTHFFSKACTKIEKKITLIGAGVSLESRFKIQFVPKFGTNCTISHYLFWIEKNRYKKKSSSRLGPTVMIFATLYLILLQFLQNLRHI